MEQEDVTVALWKNYSSNRSLEHRNQLFEFYSVWVKKIASHQFALLRPISIDWSDCVQNASIALMDVIGRYDHARGVPFEAYAYPRIKGAIINGIPKSGFISLEGVNSKEEWSANTHFSFEADSDDFDQFIDAVLDIAFSQFLDMSSRRAARLNDDPMNAYISFSEEKKILKAVEVLPDDLRFIIVSHYNHYLTFTQIAKEMCLSKARISQMHQDALKKLRRIYDDS